MLSGLDRYLNDELEGPKALPALRDHYQWTANGDPDHPAWAVLTSAALGSLRDYISTTDVIGTDDYTISDGKPPQVSMGSAGQMDAIRKQTDNAVPVWQVLQINNMKVYDKDCAHCITPTYAMERSITWQAIVRGANGVVYYSFFVSSFASTCNMNVCMYQVHNSDLATPNLQDMMSGCHRTNTCPLDVSNLTQWARMSRIAAEVETFAPVLLSDAGKAPAVTVLNATGGVPGWVATRERWDDAGAFSSHPLPLLF